ncbi:MAG: hypothetical protein ACPGQL_04710 [Thermoplasmatota archaeon]
MNRTLALAPFLLMLALSGCLSDDDDADAAGGEPEGQLIEGPESGPVRTYNGTFDLVINPDLEVIAFGGASANCVFFWETDGARYDVLAGNVTLTWDALPNTPSFSIRVTGTDDDVETAGAGSPVTLTFDQISVDFDWGIGFHADYTLVDGTLPVAQAATMDVSFAYTGELPEPGIGTCAGGGV